MPPKKRSIYRDVITHRTIIAIEHLIALGKARNETEMMAGLNITFTTLFRWKSRRNAPTIENLAVLADKFGVSAEYLLLGRGRVMRSENDVQQELTAIYQRVRELNQELDLIARQKPGKPHPEPSQNGVHKKAKKLSVKKLQNS